MAPTAPRQALLSSDFRSALKVCIRMPDPGGTAERAPSELFNQLPPLADQLPDVFVKRTLLGGKKPVPQRILIAHRRAGPLRASVHPAARFPGYGRRLAGRSLSGLRATAATAGHRPGVPQVVIGHELHPASGLRRRLVAFLTPGSKGTSTRCSTAAGYCAGRFARAPVSTFPTIA